MTLDDESRQEVCRYCCSTIDVRVRYCRHCGKPRAFRDRVLVGFRSCVEVASFIGTAVAVIILVISVVYTRDQLQMQREALDREREQSSQQDSLTRAHLNLLASQLEEAKRAIALQQRVLAADSEKTIAEGIRKREENRPNLQVQFIDWRRDSTDSRLIVNLRNFGKSSASACKLVTTIHLMPLKLTVACDTNSFDNVVSDLPKAIIIPSKLDTETFEFIIRTEIDYSWQPYGLWYREEKYFSLNCKSKPTSCRCLSLGKEGLKDLW